MPDFQLEISKINWIVSSGISSNPLVTDWLWIFVKITEAASVGGRGAAGATGSKGRAVGPVVQLPPRWSQIAEWFALEGLKLPAMGRDTFN